MWDLVKSNNRLCSWCLHVCISAGAAVFIEKEKATTVRAVAKPQGMSSGTQLGDLIRNRVEFGKHLPLHHPPQVTVNTEHKGGFFEIPLSLGILSGNLSPPTLQKTDLPK